MGLSHEKQAEQLKARLARRAELIAERKKQDLSIDEAIIEGLLDEEEFEKLDATQKRVSNYEIVCRSLVIWFKIDCVI